MNRADLMERYRDALEAAKLSREFSFHDLRHTFGTHPLVQELRSE